MYPIGFTQSNRHRPLAGHLRVLAMMLALALPTAVIAQEAPQLLQDQMTDAEFKAAGLDQLAPAQLTNLNAWLNRTLDTQTAQAAETARQAAKAEARSEPPLFNRTTSREPVSAQLQGRFDGFARGRDYTLDNGQRWVQVDSATLPGVHLDNPKVEIRPGLIGESWYLSVEGYNTRAKVRREE